MPSMDATEFVVLPPMWQRFQPEDTWEPPTIMTKQQPRRSRRIAEKTEKIGANVGILQRPSEEAPRRSKRLEEVRDRRNAVAGDEKVNKVRTTAIHARRRRVEVRTLEQELVLACIQTYVEVTERQVSPRQLSQRKFPTEFLNAVLNKDTGELMEMRHLMKNPKYSELWRKSYTKELGRLAQGIPGTKGTNTIVFIKYDDIPLDRRRHVRYGKTVCTYRPEKDDPNRTRLTVGGNQIEYPGDVSTPTVDMMTVKMHLNSVISTKGARYCTIDLKDFYLNTPMERPEFMRLKINDLPPEFVALYNLNNIADQNGTVYMRIQKGMYGLPQAGILAQQLLEQRLNKHGY